jgi:nitrate reductase assembly molybdenum cofactor insertion protein NarJ
MAFEASIKYSQIYRFLADAFLYPQEDWIGELRFVNEILDGLKLQRIDLPDMHWDLSTLQELHRQIFGLTGSLCYETEYGLPHEFRQSQELADIAGFYMAFGFKTGGPKRERPDHLAVELEFMHLLCLKEAYALSSSLPEQAQLCRDAQRSFLNDHLGAWIGLFSQALLMSTSQAEGSFGIKNPYLALGEVASNFVLSHANSIDARPVVRSLSKVQPTPLGPEMSCGGCPLKDSIENEESCL